MFALQSAVMLEIFEPVTPGALRRSIDCRMPSRSATQEDMIEPPVQAQAHFSAVETSQIYPWEQDVCDRGTRWKEEVSCLE